VSSVITEMSRSGQVLEPGREGLMWGMWGTDTRPKEAAVESAGTVRGQKGTEGFEPNAQEEGRGQSAFRSAGSASCAQRRAQELGARARPQASISATRGDCITEPKSSRGRAPVLARQGTKRARGKCGPRARRAFIAKQGQEASVMYRVDLYVPIFGLI